MTKNGLLPSSKCRDYASEHEHCGAEQWSSCNIGGRAGRYCKFRARLCVSSGQPSSWGCGAMAVEMGQVVVPVCARTD